jgi:hypothetical protein
MALAEEEKTEHERASSSVSSVPATDAVALRFEVILFKRKTNVPATRGTTDWFYYQFLSPNGCGWFTVVEFVHVLLTVVN